MPETENKGCKLIADVAVIHNNEILLVKYSDNNKYDLQQGWFLPDDLINYLEHPENAAIRILNEQLGLQVSEVKLNHIESFSGNDRSWHLVFHFIAHIKNKAEIKPSADLAASNFFTLDALPDKKDVAHHGWALYTINDLKL